MDGRLSTRRPSAGMPHVYLVTDRAGSWPMLSAEARCPRADSPVRVELVAETDDEAAAWEAFDRLVEGLTPGCRLGLPPQGEIR
jgi:hypothetical protein